LKIGLICSSERNQPALDSGFRPELVEGSLRKGHSCFDKLSTNGSKMMVRINDSEY